MGPADDIDLSNERLVAYIDGELSASERAQMSEALARNAEARERLEHLQRGGRPFGEAFDLLLKAAPEARLQAMFADLVASSGGAPASVGRVDENVVPLRSRRPAGGIAIWQLAAAAVLLALVFTTGLYAGGFFGQPQQRAAEKPGWRESAARYVALFSKATLDGMPSDPRERQINLAKAETALGLPLSGERTASPDLAFQGTQLLQFDGKPLAQISYLLGDTTPVALCIIRTAKPPAAPAKEQRYGLNIVHWIANGYGFMVIGDVPDTELARIANGLRAHFS